MLASRCRSLSRCSQWPGRSVVSLASDDNRFQTGRERARMRRPALRALTVAAMDRPNALASGADSAAGRSSSTAGCFACCRRCPSPATTRGRCSGRCRPILTPTTGSSDSASARPPAVAGGGASRSAGAARPPTAGGRGDGSGDCGRLVPGRSSRAVGSDHVLRFAVGIARSVRAGPVPSSKMLYSRRVTVYTA